MPFHVQHRVVTESSHTICHHEELGVGVAFHHRERSKIQTRWIILETPRRHDARDGLGTLTVHGLLPSSGSDALKPIPMRLIIISPLWRTRTSNLCLTVPIRQTVDKMRFVSEKSSALEAAKRLLIFHHIQPGPLSAWSMYRQTSLRVSRTVDRIDVNDRCHRPPMMQYIHHDRDAVRRHEPWS